MRVKGKVTIITGAASGMGASHARLFAREGARVVVADILEAEGRAVVEDIVANGGEAVFERLDISSEADWERVMDAATSHFGPLDILVNNAGLTGSGVQDVDEIALFDRLMAVNLRGPFLGIRAAVRRMEGRGGAIVNIASISANMGNRGVHIGYNASKGGVRTLTRAAAAEYGPRKIRVNAVNPGVLPPMIGSKRVDVAEALLQRVPLNRTGEVDEVSHAVLFLASDDASYINGVEINVDGGLTIT